MVGKVGKAKIAVIEKMGEDSGLPLLKKVLVGWEGIEDEDGNAVPFSSKELELFSDDVDWLKAVLTAYTNTYAEGEAGN